MHLNHSALPEKNLCACGFISFHIKLYLIFHLHFSYILPVNLSQMWQVFKLITKLHPQKIVDKMSTIFYIPNFSLITPIASSNALSELSQWIFLFLLNQVSWRFAYLLELCFTISRASSKVESPCKYP